MLPPYGGAVKSHSGERPIRLLASILYIVEQIIDLLATGQLEKLKAKLKVLCIVQLDPQW